MKFHLLSKDNSAYHTGMLDINDRALLLKINVMDATPYMYVSPENMMMSIIWVAVSYWNFCCTEKKERTTTKRR